MIRFNHGDVIAWSKDYDGPLFHALLCDAPYHLTSIVKRFGKAGSAPAQPGRDGAFSRVSRGFMGEEWDGGDLAFKKETWEPFLKVLYPGAFGIAFAGSRGWHRMAVAIEDAGFIIHPTIFGWAYGSGLPKATKVKKDDRFKGHRYGLQALKPAVEPFIVFQKPYAGRALDNITETGAGTLNIDGTRIPLEHGDNYVINRYNGLRPFGGGEGAYKTVNAIEGRWASNLILLDLGAAAALDRQSGHSESHPSDYDFSKSVDDNPTRVMTNIKSGVHYGDAGGASRYFFVVREQIEEADPIFYCKKASRREKDAGLSGRNPHPTVKPIELTKYLAALLLPPADYSPRRLFVPFSGVGSEAIGAKLAGWDEVHGVEITKKYIPIAEARAEFWINRHAEQLNLI